MSVLNESSIASSLSNPLFRAQRFARGTAASLSLDAAGEMIAASWQRAGNHIPSFTGPSRDLRESWEVQPESFTAMVVADLLMGQPEHRGLVASILAMLEDEMCADGLFHFFKEHERLPADADCTALGLSVLLRGGALVTDQANLALDRIIANSNAAGVIETYFDPSGERSGIVDPVVCANVLFLAHMLGRGDELAPTLDYLHRVLVAGDYSAGTRYYHSPDTFLYFTARLVRRFPALHKRLLEPLVRAVRERQGATEFPLDVAQRVIISRWLRIDDGGESEKLVDLQEDDGCWPADSLFRYGRKKIFFGSRLVTTAFALRALRVLDSGVPHGSRG
jgi:hypothetical protein